MHRRIRQFLACIAASLSATLLVLALSESLQGPSVDTLYWLREAVYGPRGVPEPSPVVVVGIDEETYRRPPFAGTPQALWGPRLGRVLGAMMDGGAKVIGLDLIHPTSVEGLIPGFERDYLLTLRRGGKEGKLVLAKVQHQTDPLLPYRGYAIAAGGTANIRSVNLIEDPDGVLRRAPVTLQVAGPDGLPRHEPGMAVEVASRALGAALERGSDGSAVLAGYRIPGDGSSILVNPPTAAGAIPTYSLADLFACAEAGRTDFFAKHFQGKAVMVGTTLDVEDRKLTSNRWVTKPEGQNLPERCAVPVMGELYKADLRRDSIPGVYIHAAAILNLIGRDALTELGPVASGLLVLALAAAAAALTLATRPAVAAAGLVALLAAWSAGSVAAFHGTVGGGGLVLPYLSGALAIVLVFPLVLGVRFAVLDRDQRQIRNAFKLYLPGTLIDDMIASGQSPRLGGEERDLSILFCDIAGFTRMSEGMEPEALVGVLNRYFTVMTDIIEAHGGFVDKYIGDAVLAVFGAPYRNENHARAAVDAALAMREAMETDPTLLATEAGVRGSNRIGIATGPALIGNIGSPRRFNYTVMGDTVNLASRLEGANKYYGTFLMVSGETVAQHGDPGRFRELDTVQVVGRVEPVRVFEPLSDRRLADPQESLNRAAYDHALADWRAGRFTDAALAFGALTPMDPAAAAMQRKAIRQATQPAAAGWTGVTALTEK